MKKDSPLLLHMFYLSLIFIIVVVAYSRNISYINTKQELELHQEKVAELYVTIGEYKNNENWFEDFIDLIAETYEQEIKTAVLEERIKWLEEINDGNNNLYNKEEMYIVVDQLLRFALEIQEDESASIAYDEKKQIIIIFKYNDYGELLNTYTYTLDEVIYEIFW